MPGEMRLRASFNFHRREKMRRSKSEIYLHFVWATKDRKPWLTPSIEREAHRCIEGEARRLKAVVLALNGMPDHVHLVAQMPTSLCAAQLAKQVKGVTSAFINDNLEIEEAFRWQEGYGVFSLSRSHLKRAIACVQRQKTHHAQGSVWELWEETDEEVMAEI
jgi:REP element-mobilizing transposase RayT